MPSTMPLCDKSVKTASQAEDACSTIRATEISLGKTKYSKTGGENVSTKLGREKHKEYNPGDDYIKEFRLPSGKRADAVSPDIKWEYHIDVYDK